MRHGRSASQTLLELPALLDLLFASSSTGRAHSRSHHQPSASASLSQTQKTVIAVYETKETDGCQSLLFGIRRLPIFPGSAHMVAVRCGEADSFSSLCLSSSDSLLRPPDALTVDPITSPWLFDLARKIPTHQRPKKNTMRCMVFFFGIRRLPIFPGRHQPSIFGV